MPRFVDSQFLEFLHEYLCLAFTMVTVYISALICCLLVNYVCGLTTIPPTAEDGTAVVVARVNATNVTVFCNVTSAQGNPLLTSWILMSDGTSSPIDANTPGFMLAGTFLENLTISSFTLDRNGSVLECTNNIIPRQSAFFSLRIFGKK